MYNGMDMFYTGDICKGVSHEYIWFSKQLATQCPHNEEMLATPENGVI